MSYDVKRTASHIRLSVAAALAAAAALIAALQAAPDYANIPDAPQLATAAPAQLQTR
jgi:hypothetical protein